MVTGTVTLDSRTVGPGDLFVAFAGERVDGHDFLVAAAAAGAVAALSSRPDDALPTVVVADPVVALGRLAAGVHARLTAAGLRTLAITGSSGKTSTKDLLGQVLGAAGPTVSPPGSYNNDIGLPLTVLSADERTRFLVLEMGSRGVGAHRPPVPTRPVRRSAWCSTSAPPTSVSSAAPRASPARRASWSRRCPGTAPPCSTPTTRGWPAWRRAPAPAC